MSLPTILSPDGRRAWAFLAVVGGCMVFTGFAAVGVWLNRNHADHAFWLALAAHLQVLVGLTCVGALLVRRVIRGGKDGFELRDEGVDPGPTTTVTATATVQGSPAAPAQQGETG